jgi:hypothetical protein
VSRYRTLRQARLDGELTVTSRARRAVAELCSADGPQHLVLDWPDGAVLLPPDEHSPQSSEVIVGHLARCPIFADVRQLVEHHDRRLLDVDERRRNGSGARPKLVLRAESVGVDGDRPAM